MFGHMGELLIVLGIGLIVFGPEKLPEVAATAGKMVREFREMMDTALNPQDTEVPDDFSTYYYESLARSGEEVPDHMGPDPFLVVESEEDEGQEVSEYPGPEPDGAESHAASPRDQPSL